MFHTTEELLTALKAGEIVLLLDDEDRENEGDLICAAEFATPDLVNFMATYGKGLICMPMSKAYTQKFKLPQMVAENTDHHHTAFTVSIDALETTTGISAAERSMTALKTVADEALPSDFRRPGHMFPLEAKEGGVLVRDGHTEATVDLMRLAGLKEVGLCCEIMSKDGLMARTPELLKLAEEHSLKIGTIADLKSYRISKEKAHYKRNGKAKMPTKYGDFEMYTYVNDFNEDHHIALVMGDLSDGEAVLCRVHSECLTGDVFGSKRCDCGQQLEASLKKIAEEQRGILVYLRQEGRGIGLVNKMHAYELQDQGYDTVDANLKLGFPADMREYHMAQEILEDLHVSRIRLMTNNPSKIEGLAAYGMDIVERVPLQTKLFRETEAYMQTKKTKMGHLI